MCSTTSDGGRRALAALLLLAALAWPLPARAEVPAAARELFREGTALLQQGQREAALERFQRAHALYPSYKVALSVATTCYELDRHAQAADYFDRFFRGGGERAPEPIVRVARQRFAEAQSRVARLSLRCSTDGAQVKLDGQSLGATPLPRPLFLAPGPHRLELSRPGKQPHARTLELRAGQRLELQLELSAIPPAPAAASEPAESQAEETPALDPEPSPVPHEGSKVWGWVALGASVALAGGAGALYGLGARQGNQAHETYSGLGPDDPQSSYRESLDEMDAGQAKLVAGHVLAGAALVAAGVAVYLLVRQQPPREQRPGSASPTPRLSLKRGLPALGLEF